MIIKYMRKNRAAMMMRKNRAVRKEEMSDKNEEKKTDEWQWEQDAWQSCY